MRHVSVRRGSYVDSVTLMQVSRRVSACDGVTSALVAMATDLNLELAAGLGFDVPAASPNEMLLAVDAHSDDALTAAVAEADAALAEASHPAVGTGLGSAPPPVTVKWAKFHRSGLDLRTFHNSSHGQHANSSHCVPMAGTRWAWVRGSLARKRF